MKVFVLIADEISHKFHEGFEPVDGVEAWGYNGVTPGPALEAMRGDTLHILFLNRMKVATTVHWHGVELPHNMDGSSGVSHDPIPPGESYIYEYKIVNRQGTYMYHSGHNPTVQTAMGLNGFLIVHPKGYDPPHGMRDYALFLNVWKVHPHSRILDSMTHEANFFTINGKAAPSTTPLMASPHEKVRVRFGNTVNMAHPIHLHGFGFKVIGASGGKFEEGTGTISSTVNVVQGETADILIDVKETAEKVGEKSVLGEWLFHCHRLHHIHNNMGISPVPGEPMHHGEGGMFTKLIVAKPGGGHHGGDEGGGHHGGDEGGGHHGGDEGGGHHGGDEGGGHRGHQMKMFPMPGRYIGTIDINESRSVLASFDIFKVQEDHEWRKLRATMKLYFGDFSSNEYITYTFDEIEADWKGGKLHLTDSTSGIRITDFRVSNGGHGGSHGGVHGSGHGGEQSKTLKGLFQFPAGRITSNINLVPIDSEMANHVVHHSMNRLVFPLEAEYIGSCGEKNRRLVLFTGRNFVKQESTRNPFDAYRIGGALGGVGNKATIEYGVMSGSYDFFREKLRLNLKYGTGFDTTACDVARGKISCNNGCNLTRREPYQFSMLLPSQAQLNAELILPETAPVTQLSKSEKFEGTMQGYIHLEHTDRYQPLAFDVRVTTEHEDSWPMKQLQPFIQITATQFFSNTADEFERLWVPFHKRPFLNSRSMHTGDKNTLLLDSDFDAYAVIERWQENGIEGVWYSKVFGRIGKFLVQRDPLEWESTPNQDVPGLTGQYSGQLSTGLSFRLDLGVSDVAEETDEQIYNPIFPLSYVGGLRQPRIGLMKEIHGVSYDYFTGKFLLEFPNEGIGSGYVHRDYLDWNLIFNRNTFHVFPEIDDVQMDRK